jgi:hypothetical protein
VGHAKCVHQDLLECVILPHRAYEFDFYLEKTACQSLDSRMYIHHFTLGKPVPSN